MSARRGRREGISRRTRSWRIALSALAGGGLTIVGLGGPLTGGAFGAEANTGTTGPGSESSTSTTAEAGSPSAGASTGTSTTGTSTSGTSTSGSSTTSSTGSPTGAGTTTTGTSTAAEPTSTTANPAPPKATSGSPRTHASEAPTVVVRRSQRSTASRPPNPNVTATKAGGQQAGQGSQGSSGAQAGASNNVAPPPQLVAEQASALAALLDGSGQASAQALNFYRIPLFLLPIYQAAAAQYDVPWPVLAAINEVETDYGTDLSVSSAGAEGWMQFEPSTWLQYGVDALNAGYADPYNPVDAIFAAARYLNAAGAAHDLSGAIMAYNHSEAYVESVLLRAKLIAAYPDQVIATLTGMIDGRPPVTGKRIAWGTPITLDGDERGSAGSGAGSAGAPLSAGASSATAGASPIAGSAGAGAGTAQGSGAAPGSTDAPAPGAAASAGAKPTTALQGVDVSSEPNARAVAVQDGRVVKLGYSRKLGKYVVLQDIYGDLFTYAGLGSIAHSYVLPKGDAPASASQDEGAAGAGTSPSGPSHTGAGKVRVFAHPGPGNQDARAAAASARRMTGDAAGADGRLPLRVGSVVAEGTVLGRVADPPNASDGHLLFAIRPAGDSSTIDPSTILENWVQLDAALHPRGAKGDPSLLGATATDVFLLTKSQLERTVLADPGISLSACSRHQVAAGAIDKRALAVLAFLARSGLQPTVGTLRCGAYDAAGYVLPGHSGDAVAIVAINGTPIAGHQGAGTITDTTIRTLLTIQDEYAPARIVSLMRYPGAPSTIARADHGAYIELVFPPSVAHAARRAHAAHAASAGTGAAGAGQSASSASAVPQELSSVQWEQLIGRIAALPTPNVAFKPSSAAIPDRSRAASK